MEIDKVLLQTLFDVAVGGTDFGSGHLCDEDVEALRAVAVLLEVDPDEATPNNFKCKYTGKHLLYRELYAKEVAEGKSLMNETTLNMCTQCRQVFPPEKKDG